MTKNVKKPVAKDENIYLSDPREVVITEDMEFMEDCCEGSYYTAFNQILIYILIAVVAVMLIMMWRMNSQLQRVIVTQEVMSELTALEQKNKYLEQVLDKYKPKDVLELEIYNNGNAPR